MKIRGAFLFAWILTTLIIPLAAGNGGLPDRGRYVYDDADRLSVESEIALNSYLRQIDSRTDYELVVVLSKEKMEEDAIKSWFNSHGVGKKDKNNGAAILIFPDNSAFLAIGSRNDKVAVAYIVTYNKIFTDLNDDFSLSILRFVSFLGSKIDEPTLEERVGKFGENVAVNIDLILLWASVAALAILLVQQKDGFQTKDLIIPMGLLLFAGIFIVASMASTSEEFKTYEEYGIITSSKLSDYTYSVTTCTGSGENRVCTTTWHTDYRNDVTILSYEFEPYTHRFVTTDHKGAWDHKVGEVDTLVLNVKHETLQGVYTVNDNSGGETRGDGVWINTGMKKGE